MKLSGITEREVRNAVKNVVFDLFNNHKLKRATKYLDVDLVVRGVKRGRPRHNENFDIVLKIGRPNYAETKFIKLCLKAHEVIPVGKVQWKFYK
jgi:hypothetical protein